jgi:hypothetical protein
MNKKILIILVTLLGFSTVSQAQQALTKELITSFQMISQQWKTLEKDYPELTSSLDDIDFSQPDKLINKIKQSKAYPKIKSMLAGTDFGSIEEYYNVSMRVMGGIMAHQMQKMPQDMDVNSLSKMLKNNIQQMKASNAPSSMVNELEKQLADMEKNMKMMKSAMQNTSAEDQKFISENAKWIMSVLDEK